MSYLYLCPRRESRENWTPAQTGRLDLVGGWGSIPSIVLSTKKNVLLLIDKAKYKMFSEDNGGLFGCKIPKHVIE